MKWSFKFGIATLCASSISFCFAYPTSRTYNLEHAKYCKNQDNANFYIRAASFSFKSNAERYQKLLQSRTSYPVTISHKSKYHVVLIGPIKCSAELKKTASALLELTTQKLTKKTLKTKKKKNQIQKTNTFHYKPRLNPTSETVNSNKATSIFKAKLSTDVNWFAMIGAGGGFPISQQDLSINNGSLFPAPYDRDIYTIKQSSNGIVNAMIGRRWELSRAWIPAVSLGVFYQHNFSNLIKGTVTQYSLPEYTNYNYHWNILSDIILASTKVNIYSQGCFSPYIAAGIGGAFNQSNYSESPLVDITPRLSPDFSGNNNQFAYNVGAGIDFRASNHCIISIGYMYQNLGHLSGKGKGTWSGTSLNLGNYGLNEILASISYLF